MTALAACPFCGGVETTKCPIYGSSTGWRRVCDGCRALGPMGTTEAEAAELWNRRAAPGAVVQDGEYTVARLNADGVAE